MSWDPCDWCKTVTGVDPREEINKLENTVVQVYDKAKAEVKDDYDKAKAAVGNAYDKGKAAVGAEMKKAEGALGIGGAKGGAGGLSLGGSVGRGGKNNPEEVKAVQRALGIQDDGKCGPGTIKAIEDFQRSIGQAKPDGRVDPGGATARALASGAKPSPGTATLPEITIVGDPQLGAAYQIGFSDGQYGYPGNRPKFKGKPDALDEYDRGFSDGQNAPRDYKRIEPEEGPAIGPLSADDAEQDRATYEATERANEAREEFLGHKHMPHTESPTEEGPPEVEGPVFIPPTVAE